MIVSSWAKRSTPAQSASVTTPIGRLPSTTMTAPCARLGSSDRASAAVAVGSSVIGVSWTRPRAFTQAMTSLTTSTGMSCGRTARPPRRAIVSAMRRPETAVMFAATTGIVVPTPSGVVRSTSRREATSERRGTRKTSS